jgi:hypothetical protein
MIFDFMKYCITIISNYVLIIVNLFSTKHDIINQIHEFSIFIQVLKRTFE